MRLFYDENGKIVGTFQGTSPGVEDKVKIPGTTAIIAPRDVASNILNPKKPHTEQYYEIRDSKVVEVTKKQIDKINSDKERMRDLTRHPLRRKGGVR